MEYIGFAGEWRQVLIAEKAAILIKVGTTYTSPHFARH